MSDSFVVASDLGTGGCKTLIVDEGGEVVASTQAEYPTAYPHPGWCEQDPNDWLVAVWRKPGYIWEIPYGTLIPQDIKGLITAGRCISSANDAWEITRLIPAAALTGQVAGVAARLAIQHNTTPERKVTGRGRTDGVETF